MSLLGPRLLIFLAVGTGGGSLVLFAYFLLFGVPFALEITDSHPARLLWDSLLCVVFFLQHSGMIRRGAKERIAKRVPGIYYPAVYSIASGTALFALLLLWQPTNQFLVRLHGPARWLAVCLSVLAVAGFTWGCTRFTGLIRSVLSRSRHTCAGPLHLLLFSGPAVPTAMSAIPSTCACSCSSGPRLTCRPIGFSSTCSGPPGSS